MREGSQGCKEEPSDVGLKNHRRQCESFIGNQGMRKLVVPGTTGRK